jgi:hypothetical protein
MTRLHTNKPRKSQVPADQIDRNIAAALAAIACIRQADRRRALRETHRQKRLARQNRQITRRQVDGILHRWPALEPHEQLRIQYTRRADSSNDGENSDAR